MLKKHVLIFAIYALCIHMLLPGSYSTYNITPDYNSCYMSCYMSIIECTMCTFVILTLCIHSIMLPGAWIVVWSNIVSTVCYREEYIVYIAYMFREQLQSKQGCLSMLDLECQLKGHIIIIHFGDNADCDTKMR